MGSCFLNKYGLYFDRCQNQQFFPRSRKFGLPVLYDSGLVRSDRAVQPPGYEYSDGCKKNARVYFFFCQKTRRVPAVPRRVNCEVGRCFYESKKLERNATSRPSTDRIRCAD